LALDTGFDRSLPHARAVLDVLRRDYTEARRYSKLGWMTPRAYAGAIGTAGTLRYAACSPPRPLATQQTQGSNHGF
jgi:putative transposase